MWRLSSSKVQQLRLPVLNTSKLRVAELSGRTRFAGTEAFAASRWLELKLFGPNVLVGSASELQRLIQRLDLRTLELSSIDHGVFVVTEIGDKPLSDSMRVVLWQRFGVPVYELYMGPEQQLLARECEAQSGWHVESGAEFELESGQLVLHRGEISLPAGFEARLVSAVCGCGRAGVRIVLGSAVADDRHSPFAATA